MSEKKILIVGGGIIGIALSKFLSLNKKNKITILDSSHSLGGFLKSVKYRNMAFDLGTHYIKETGNKNLDKILFKKIKKKWIKINFIKSGNFFKKKIIEQNQFINLKEINQYQMALKEIIKKRKIKKKFNNEFENCINSFGPIITKKIISPILFKYTGLKLKKVPIGLSAKFALGRMIINNNQLTYKLKKNKRFNKFIAYESNEEGLAKVKSYYPKKGCLDEFIKLMLPKKVKILLNKQIKNFNIKNNFIKEIIFTNDETMKFDKIFWTVPREAFNKILGIPEKKKPLQKIFWQFVNLTSNRKFKSKCFYLNIHDPKTNLYRITLYNNLQKNQKLIRATLESISPKNKFHKPEFLKRYLIKIGLISNKQKIKFINSVIIPINISLKNKKFLQKTKIRNIKFLGGGFFNQKNQEQSLTDAYKLAKN